MSSSALKNKELSSPVIGHKGIQVPGPTVPLGVLPQLGSTDHSPHALRKGSKKLAPGPPKVPYGGSGGGGMASSDPSTGGQPSPVSLSPTPPSTPSPYGPLCPPGQMMMALVATATLSPGQQQQQQQQPPPGSGPYSLSSPPSLAGTLTKSRPGHGKPRQRPSLPPPQPPGPGNAAHLPDSDPHLQQGLLEGLSPGESMSTGKHHHPQHHHHLHLHQQQQQQQQQQPPTTPGTPPSPPQVMTLQRPSLRLALCLPLGSPAACSISTSRPVAVTAVTLTVVNITAVTVAVVTVTVVGAATVTVSDRYRGYRYSGYRHRSYITADAVAADAVAAVTVTSVTH
ncbi:LOW QUALITY PROTEIN: hypothetical protein CRUP_038536 [Coryphaenoides rupestris]|nr:LOW QUALITY PROTEIN: hypothetical protein CRUP_038536 [Coryphaenoides rupestris]